MEQLTLFDMNKKNNKPDILKLVDTLQEIDETKYHEIEVEDKDTLEDVTNHVKFVHD